MHDPAAPLTLTLTRLVQQGLARALHEAAAADAAAPLRLPPAARAEGLQQLAAHHPGGPAGRRAALRLYQRCLAHYRQRLQPQLGGSGADDMGLAAAFFVLANLGALSGREPDPAPLPALERQLRHWLGAGWPALPLAERQRGFEQLAALGVLVNESRVAAAMQGPAAQVHLAATARAYLQQLLGLDADRLSASAAGLAFGEAVH